MISWITRNKETVFCKDDDSVKKEETRGSKEERWSRKAGSILMRDYFKEGL